MKKHKKITLLIITLIITIATIQSVRNRIKDEFSIPILMYHSITDGEKRLFKVSKERFYDQMKYLRDNAFNTLSLDEVYYYLSNNKPFPEKSVVITFDDGYKDNYKNAYPILKEFNNKATFFVITDHIDKGSFYMSSGELKNVNQNNIQVESHTTNHPKLNRLKEATLIQTLMNSKKYLDELLNQNTKYISYPYGKYNNKVIENIKKIGYKMAFTTRNGFANSSNGMYKLKRIFISGHTRMREFSRLVN